MGMTSGKHYALWLNAEMLNKSSMYLGTSLVLHPLNLGHIIQSSPAWLPRHLSRTLSTQDRRERYQHHARPAKACHGSLHWWSNDGFPSSNQE